MARNVILLTATITPLDGIPSLARTDPKQRLEDYKAALYFYVKQLGTSFESIVFAENSNSDLSDLRALVEEEGCSDKVEFISFFGLDYPPQYGRGYGEFRLVDYAIDSSPVLQRADVIWKVTGRYIIENLPKLIKSKPPDADLYCHMRNYPYELCELYLLGWTRRAYDVVIRGAYKKLRNDLVPNTHTVEEGSFRRLLETVKDNITIVPRFKVVPIVTGIRGWNNSNYSNSWSAKIFARRVANYLMPSLWI